MLAVPKHFHARFPDNHRLVQKWNETNVYLEKRERERNSAKLKLTTLLFNIGAKHFITRAFP